MFFIDSQSRKAVYEQLCEQAERLIAAGLLKAGEPMPSVRSLSVSLGVNPNTIQKAYTELDRRGLIYSSPGKGCFVSDNAASVVREEKIRQLGEVEALAASFAAAGVEKSIFMEAVDNGYRKTEAKA